MITNGVTLFKNVAIGKGAIVEHNVIVGLPPPNTQDGERPTRIGRNAYIRAGTVIYAGVTIGDDFQTGPSVVIREDNTIGNKVCIWAHTVLNPKNVVGDGCIIHVGCFLEDVTLGKQVFVAPHVMFANDPHPTNPPRRTCMKGAIVKNNVVIGGNVTVLPHVTIGRGALIGAGSVVTKDVPPRSVVVGNPGRVIKKTTQIVCRTGGKAHSPYRQGAQ